MKGKNYKKFSGLVEISSPIQRRRFLMLSGDFPASSKRTQAQTLNEWAEYRCSSSFEMLGRTAFAAAQKWNAILEPVI